MKTVYRVDIYTDDTQQTVYTGEEYATKEEAKKIFKKISKGCYLVRITSEILNKK